MSDSGADLTYLEGHSEALIKENLTMNEDANQFLEFNEIAEDDNLPSSPMSQTSSKIDNNDVSIVENYLNMDSWERFWSVNGERLIWASWIEKYSDYINPSYWEDEKNQNESGLPNKWDVKEAELGFASKSADSDKKNNKSTKKEGKFPFDLVDSSISPKIADNHDKDMPDSAKAKESSYDLPLSEGWNPLSPASIDETWSHSHHKHRSFSENDQLLSPRCDSVSSSVPQTIGTSDSMTNVTKITSYDINSSHLPTDSSESNISLFSSAESSEESRSNSTNSSDKENLFADAGMCGDDACNDIDQYWQILWKKHFNEQYSLHYENYLLTHPHLADKFKSDKIESSNDSFKIESVSEKSDKKTSKNKHNKVNKKDNQNLSRMQINSVGYLLQQLNIESNEKISENEESCNNINVIISDKIGNSSILDDPMDSPENKNMNNKGKTPENNSSTTNSSNVANILTSNTSSNLCNQGNGDEPPDEKKIVSLKRRYVFFIRSSYLS